MSKTILEKTYKPAEIEAKNYNKWEKSKAFSSDSSDKTQSYCVMMPPPNVTGSLHMGHALNNTLQDVLTRYHRKLGQSTLWQPGMDHAGIATQMIVERKLLKEGVERRDMSREAFIEKVWAWKEESGGNISSQLRRLGCSADWSRERFTMDKGLSEAVREVFVKLHKEGLIYRDKRLVNWDPKLQTAISDLEVEQRDEPNGSLWHFRYPLDSDNTRYLVVATTRPETLLGDTAVAVNPDDERWQSLIGKELCLPLTKRKIIVIGDDYADPEQGSGAVKITPAHDFNDFEVGRRHNLEMINIFDSQGRLNENVPDKYKGLDRFQARKKVIEDMDFLGLLDHIEPHSHTLPYGDRSGVVIEPWLTDQWYVNASELAKPAIAAVENGNIRIIPKQWENTYFEWMLNIQPWCISRQLWWGHRIPAWYGPDKTVFVELSEEEAKQSAKIHYGIDVELNQDDDVLDTWFSSGLWPFSTLGWPQKSQELEKYYPNTDLITGFDIIFFWVARMIMLGIHFMGKVPFQNVYIHALVRDENGQKMSKSRGNVIDPLELIDKYGADALRFTLVAMEAQGRDIKLSESRIEGYRNFATKLWNAARFCEANKCNVSNDFNPLECNLAINRWIVAEVVLAVEHTEKALDSYRFNEAAQTIYQFTWGKFCDWYLEFAKTPFSSDVVGEIEETKATAAWILEQILHLLHPIMPFVTEELWSRTNHNKKVLLIESSWPKLSSISYDEGVSKEIEWIMRLITAIRTIRSEMNVPASARIAVFLDELSKENINRINQHREMVMRLCRLEEIELLIDIPPKGSLQIIIDEATAFIPLSGVIDLNKERSRLQQEIEKIEKNIKNLSQKLNNKQFIERAPENVIGENRIRLKDAEEAKNKTFAALNRIMKIGL